MRIHRPWLGLNTVIVLWVFGSVFQGCKTATKSSEMGTEIGSTKVAISGETEWMNSSIQINYSLGKDQHSFIAHATNGRGKPTATATIQINRHTLETGEIPMVSYADFYKRTLEILRETKSHPNYLEINCHTPFTIRIKTASHTETGSGCRETDKGKLARLVRDGEFILYSASERK